MSSFRVLGAHLDRWMFSRRLFFALMIPLLGESRESTLVRATMVGP